MTTDSKQHKFSEYVWSKPCPSGCDDWVCESHQLHVYECECPDLETFLDQGWNPYEGERLVGERLINIIPDAEEN